MCAAPVRWSFAFNQVLFHYSQSFLCAFAREWNFELSEATPRDFVTFSVKKATKRIYGNRKSHERNSLDMEDYNKALTMIAKSVGRESSDLLLSHSTTLSYLLHYERQNPLLAFSSKGLLMKYFPWAGSRRRWKKTSISERVSMVAFACFLVSIEIFILKERIVDEFQASGGET